MLGLAVASGSAWLGGHLAFAQGVGVDQTAFEDAPTSWTPLIDARKLKQGRPVRRSARGTPILLLRHERQIHALLDRCNHRGCSLSEGIFDGTAITCPCHGSQFGVDGRLLREPATSPQPTLETRVQAGRVEVRATPE
jgi:nitrite reductase/ring-hydroxylating ferredoxin subunit